MAAPEFLSRKSFGASAWLEEGLDLKLRLHRKYGVHLESNDGVWMAGADGG